MNETIKEFLRGIITAIIPVIIVQLSDPSITLRVGIVAVVIAILRAIDEFLSEKKLGINDNGISGM